MKHVHKDTQACIRAYYQRSASWGRNGKGSVFFDGDTLYSYGRHFVLVKRLPSGAYLKSTRSYSVSTSRHQRYSHPAGNVCHYVNDAAASPEENTRAYISDYRASLRQEARARNPRNLAEHWHHAEFRRYLEEVGRPALIAQIEAVEYEKPRFDPVKKRFTLAIYDTLLPFKEALRLAEFRNGMLAEAGTRDDGTVRLPSTLVPHFGKLGVAKIDQEWVYFSNGARLPHQTISYMADIAADVISAKVKR